MDHLPKSLHTKSEIELAGYQTHQLGNTCSFHVIAASMRLLLNYNIDPMVLGEEVNRLWWRGRFMRVAPNWAVTPRMQVRIVRHLAQTRGLPVAATYQRSDPEILPALLPNLTTVPIVTIIWPWHKAPPIYLGNTTYNFNRTLSAGGHSMLLAAYDPEHMAGEDRFPTPWGFINPWLDNTTQLFWMRDGDFRQAWHFCLPGIGPNPLVLVQRTGSTNGW